MPLHPLLSRRELLAPQPANKTEIVRYGIFCVVLRFSICQLSSNDSSLPRTLAREEGIPIRISPERRALPLPQKSARVDLAVFIFSMPARPRARSCLDYRASRARAGESCVYRPILGTSWLMRSRASSMTTAFPRITTMPMRTFSPPAFSSNASSSTMLR